MAETRLATLSPPPPMVQFRNFLDARAAEIKTALPAHISPERFIRVVITAAQINPEIIACDRQSLWNACMRAANAGLLPDGQEGAIVPFKSRATWIPMYQGLLKQFRNSGEFKWIGAGIVREGDEYDHWIDETGEHFRHRPSDHQAGKIRRVYALATTKDGGSFIADLSLAEIEKHRAQSRANREDAPWKVWFEEMAKKTAIRVLSKLLPKSSDIDALMRRDEEALYNEDSVDERRETLAQPIGTAATLDAFGADAHSAPEEGGGQENPTTPDASTVAARSDDESEARSPAAADQSQEQIAFERGKSDRARGTKRSAVPGEYREDNRLGLAWIRGWEEGK